MAKEKMSKAERQQLEADLATLRRAVTECEKELAADDEAVAADKAATGAEIIKAAVKRDGSTVGFLLAREMGRRGGPKE
jgi:hypothetical protein